MSEQTYTITLTKEQIQLLLDCLYSPDEQFTTEEQNACFNMADHIIEQTGVPLKQEEAHPYQKPEKRPEISGDT